MWVPYSLAARLLVREVSLERCVLVPHASELAFFSVGGRRRSGPELRRKTRLRTLEVVARARRRRGASRPWWRHVSTERGLWLGVEMGLVHPNGTLNYEREDIRFIIDAYRLE